MGKQNIILIAALILGGCTFATGDVTTGKFTVFDLHPGGEAISLDGRITGKGSLVVDRSTGDSSSAVDAIVGAAVAL